MILFIVNRKNESQGQVPWLLLIEILFLLKVRKKENNVSISL